ncbi:MAG: hypothetical protein EXS13_00430 [Planctomycetes bacterium]|nr:hypothetical protein [Planctomycetota bacterium]
MSRVLAAIDCSQCRQPLENPQRCRSCGAFQAHDPRRDHFSTLALDRSFDLDEAALERRVVQFSRDLHPDLAGGAVGGKARAVLGAAQVNEAYAVLRDRFRRGEYLLQLGGGPTAAQDKAVPDGFLEAMLDERDAVDAALAAGTEACDALAAKFTATLRGHEAVLTRAFADLTRLGDATAAETARADLRGRLRRELNVMNYHRTLARDLREGRRDKEGA